MSTEADGAWVLVHYTDASSAQPHTIGLLAAGSGALSRPLHTTSAHALRWQAAQRR